MNFDLLNRVLRSGIFLHWVGQFRAAHIILGFKPISNHFQVSKHVIKTRDSCLAQVDVAVEGFISKPPLAGTQLVELPTFKDPQPIVEEITSLDEDVETESEDNTSEEGTESLVEMKISRFFIVQTRLRRKHLARV